MVRQDRVDGGIGPPNAISSPNAAGPGRDIDQDSSGRLHFVFHGVDNGVHDLQWLKRSRLDDPLRDPFRRALVDDPTGTLERELPGAITVRQEDATLVVAGAGNRYVSRGVCCEWQRALLPSDDAHA